MDPRKQECLGKYLYGAGYFARDQNTLGMVTGRSSPPHFCLSCPQQEQCQNEQEKRVREEAPARAEEFDRRMGQATKQLIPPTLAAAFLGKRGLDPYMDDAIANFNQGHADRGRVSGPLTK